MEGSETEHEARPNQVYVTASDNQVFVTANYDAVDKTCNEAIATEFFEEYACGQDDQNAETSQGK